MNFVWATKQRKQQETYAVRWARTRFQFVQCSIGSIGLRVVTFEVDDSRHSGRSLEVDVNVLKQLIEEHPRLTTCCSAERLGYSHTTVETHMSELGKTWKYGVRYHMSYHLISSNSGLIFVWH